MSNCPLRGCECGSRGSLLLRRCSACRGGGRGGGGRGGGGRLSLLGRLLTARGHCREGGNNVGTRDGEEGVRELTWNENEDGTEISGDCFDGEDVKRWISRSPPFFRLREKYAQIKSRRPLFKYKESGRNRNINFSADFLKKVKTAHRDVSFISKNLRHAPLNSE